MDLELIIYNGWYTTKPKQNKPKQSKFKLMVLDLLVLSSNIWNLLTVCKQMIIIKWFQVWLFNTNNSI